MTKNQTYQNVWEALEDDPIMVKNLTLRSELMQSIANTIQSEGFTQAQAAKIMEVTQPRVSALLKGRINDFRLDMLVNMAHRLGLSISLDIAA